MPEIENGLSELESRRRSRPAPQHPKRPVVVPPRPVAVAAPPIVEDQPVQSSPPPAPASAPLRSATRESASPAIARRPVVGPVRATQVYLDDDTMDFLRTCSAAGLMAGSRDVTNSGVIRYAVGLLAGQLTPEQVADALLEDSNTARRSPGRSRAR